MFVFLVLFCGYTYHVLRCVLKNATTKPAFAMRRVTSLM
jgi:hypothetical protein